MPNPQVIVVGAGSAGCLVARRLASEGVPVMLIEPPATAAPAADRQRPARWLNLLGSGDDWDFSTAAEQNLANRSLRWPRGRGLGGSSRINAMIWFPPTAADFQTIAQVSHWTTDQLRRAFADVRTLIQPESPRWLSQSSQRFLAAAAGLPHGQPISYQRVNRAGRRFNPAELLAASRVEVVRASVDRIVFDGDRASGVMLTSGETIPAAQQIVLSAGAIGTPAILMRSGIGPRDVLTRCNIDVRCELSDVGGNLQDHLVMPVIFAIDAAHRFEPQVTMRQLAQWQIVGGGPLSSNIAECGGLFADEQIQIHVTPTHYLLHPSPAAMAAMTIAVNATRPRSRGRLTIESADPHAAARIEANYLDAEADLHTTIEAVRLARRLAAREPLQSWTRGELLPGAKRQSDESLARSIRRYAQTLYHPVGTCAIGTVVNERLMVCGTENLQAVDASVLPALTSGNPNAMVMTVAHLA
jgi:choline dehydrogenase